MDGLNLKDFVFNGGVIGTLQIAKKLERRHDKITRHIDKLRAKIECFGAITRATTKTGGRPVNEYFLTEDQFDLFVLLMDNKETIAGLKAQIVQLYINKRNQLKLEE